MVGRWLSRFLNPGSRRPKPPSDWLDGYSGQSTNELIALADEYRLDSLVLAFEAAIEAKRQRVGAKGLTVEEYVVLTIEAIEREVNNDGYSGLFANSSNEHAGSFVAAFRAIGRTDVADLTEEAIGALGRAIPLTPSALEMAVAMEDEARDAKFESLGQRYYEVAGDLAPDLFAYIKANRDRIILSG